MCSCTGRASNPGGACCMDLGVVSPIYTIPVFTPLLPIPDMLPLPEPPRVIVHMHFETRIDAVDADRLARFEELVAEMRELLAPRE